MSEIEKEAERLTALVNQEIANACETLPRIAWQGTAERIAIGRYNPPFYRPVEDGYDFPTNGVDR